MGIQSIEEYERIQPNCTVDGMLFNLPNRHVQWRVETIYTKEPDTVAWIRSMTQGQVFYDVGANIGLYTMLAVKQGLRVFAYEPEAQNFALLVRNLALNRVSKDQCVAFPFCVTDGQSINTLRLQSLQVGGSCHSFASDLNYKREEKQWAYEQGSVGFSLDALVFECGLPQPDHIKVDVDGFEDKVLGGASKVLENVRSILVEMDSNNGDHMGWKSALESKGFRTDPDQIAKARRAEGPFTGIGNIIFYRDGDGTEANAETASV
jgi:FkbM family methyltransferase